MSLTAQILKIFQWIFIHTRLDKGLQRSWPWAGLFINPLEKQASNLVQFAQAPQLFRSRGCPEHRSFDPELFQQHDLFSWSA